MVSSTSGAAGIGISVKNSVWLKMQTTVRIKKAPAYGKIGQKEQRNIQYKVNNTRYIRAAHAEVCVSYQKSTQNLADSHDAAAVKIRRHDKGIDAHGINKHTNHCYQKPDYILSFKLPEHIVSRSVQLFPLSAQNTTFPPSKALILAWAYTGIPWLSSFSLPGWNAFSIRTPIPATVA